jgi:orotate phosphoribosyltransferase
VVVTEDATTRGTSLLEAARVVREAGADPILLCALVDRGGTCAGLAAAEGLAFTAVVTAEDLGFAFDGGS